MRGTVAGAPDEHFDLAALSYLIFLYSFILNTYSLKTKVYFSDPCSAWQKGAVENMDKLIGQYLPKGTDFRTVSDEVILKLYVVKGGISKNAL